MPLGFKFVWYSEISKFPSDVLSDHYPGTPNIGDMCNIPGMLEKQLIETPDVICGGTPCQAFSTSGHRKGLNDDRGNLTKKFVEIIDANDIVREELGKQKTIVFWENVVGVLSDKTNAFGIMISALAGLNDVIECHRFGYAGLLKGPKRNIAWRVLDAKYFGLPQQRKRVYLVAGGNDWNPENILFEKTSSMKHIEYPNTALSFTKNGTNFEVFRKYTDCLEASYGTKWNGNAAAFNGSLYVAENRKLRRLTPEECEILMGFPKGYTNITNSRFSTRYRAIGNSWAIPVIRWIGSRMLSYDSLQDWSFPKSKTNGYQLEQFQKKYTIDPSTTINCSDYPENPSFGNLGDVVEKCEFNNLFISSKASAGILRRATERGVKINPRLKTYLDKTALCVEENPYD